MKKKLKEPKVKKKLLNMLKETREFLSIDNITKLLNKRYKINRSPQIIKRYLEELESENKIIRLKYGKTN